jgi:AraC-like DNA-binding protein
VGPFEIEKIDDLISFSIKNDLPSRHKPLFNDQPLLHEEFEVFFIAAGEVSWFIENKMHVAEPGSLILFNDREVHKLHIRSDKRFKRVKLLFNPEMIRSFEVKGHNLLSCFIDRPKGKGNIRNLSAQESIEITKLFDKMEQAYANESSESKLLKLISFLEILLFTNKVFKEYDKNNESQNFKEPIASILNYIEDNIAGDLSLDTISRKCGISVYHMCRIFKKETGSTIHNYILFKRVAEAQHLLEEGWKPGKVGAMCGFGAMSRFIAAFKKVTGESPSAFKKRKGV